MTQTLFLLALSLLWVGIAYTVVLAIGGFRFYQRWRARMDTPAYEPLTWPGVSVLIPAHNEERVIENSLRRFLALDYPAEYLELVVIDDASTDGTGPICDRLAYFDDRLTVVHVPASEGGRGKSAALNAGLARCRHPYVAVYDADHRPDELALRRLVMGVQTTATNGMSYAGSVGRIVKFNRARSLLNRFCAFEWTAFQWIVQAGRSQLFDIVTFPGTHFLVKTDVLRRAGGWDPDALTEDLDLSMRVYALGERVTFVPEALSEEQDPENLGAWFRQRVRWVVGNYYVLRKHARSDMLRHPRILLDYAALAFAYVAMLTAVLMSDVLFIVGLVTDPHPDLVGTHFLVLWILAAVVFVGLLLLAQAMDGEDGWRTPLIAGLMYVTYAQLWLIVATRGLVRYARTGGRMAWDRTPRFQD